MFSIHDDEIAFLNKCQQSINIDKIPLQNAISPIGIEEFNQLLSSNLNQNRGRKRKRDRIILGIHSPLISIKNLYPIKEEKYINTTNIKTIDRTRSIEIEAPPSKKQKLNNDNEGQNESKKEFIVPKGCESWYNSDGELVEELADLDPKIVEKIAYEVVDEVDEISFDDIGGLRKEKQKIKEIVIWPLKHPEVFKKKKALLKAPRGLLLFGPPGTGKTMIAKAIASTTNATFFCVTPSTLASKWIGESAKLCRAVFKLARFMAPSIVFLDEIDSLLGKRQSDGSDKMCTLKTQFLMDFQGVKNKDSDGHVLVIGATNFPEAIDGAALRRLNKKIYIPLPDDEGRKELIKNLLKHENHNINDNDIDILVQKMKGYSGSDIANVGAEAAHGPLRDGMAQHGDDDEIILRALTRNDWESALQQEQPSVAPEEVTRYEEWNRKKW